MDSEAGQIRLKDLFIASLSDPHGNTRLLVEIAAVLWFAVVLILGAMGLFVKSPSVPPIPILLGAVVPLVLFLLAYFTWGSFRNFVLASDLRFGAAIQGWRVAGVGFLALYALGLLPGAFAIPAGLGDIAIGVTAPWITQALTRHPGFVTSRVFLAWNVFGILDLVVALTMGALCSGFLPGLAGQISTAPMARLPLVLIPAFLVPLFLMLHLTALFQMYRAKGTMP